jgi:hypothetical protein
MTNKYTTKKYLVGSQIEKYKNILRELQEEKSVPIIDPTTDPLSDTIFEPDSREPIVSILHDSKDDLEEFMKGLI